MENIKVSQTVIEGATPEINKRLREKVESLERAITFMNEKGISATVHIKATAMNTEGELIVSVTTENRAFKNELEEILKFYTGKFT